MKTISQLLLFLTFVAFLPSCATKKRRDDPSALGKFYHNTTAEFNGYYNANVLLTESIAKLNEQHEDNFNKILEVFPTTAAPNPQALAPDLDKAIEKVSVVISLHRVSDWTDDCYLLMGKCQYLKRDFETAEETFKYMLEEFPPEGAVKSKKSKKEQQKVKEQTQKDKKKAQEEARENKKKEAERKKKEREKLAKQKKKDRKKSGAKKTTTPKTTPAPEKPTETPKTETPSAEQPAEVVAEEKKEGPEKYFFRRRPAYQEGQLWFGMTLVERGKYDAANRIFVDIEGDAKTFKDVRRDLAPAMAHNALKQKRYDQAIQHLENAIRLAEEKPLKARYAYIIAQLHKKNGNSSEALNYFQKVLKYRPPYDMEFSARLQIAQNAYASGKASSEEIIKDLNKMLKDDKNIDFRDQIYYALAQIAIQNKDYAAAILNLELSLKNSTGNKVQKTESYFQLANLYFDNEKYIKAKAYFDSTLTVIAQNDERYKDVQRLSTNLTEIALNMQVVEVQDSLLRISKMSPEEKRALALAIKKREEEERLKAAQLAATQQVLANNSKLNTFTPNKAPLSSANPLNEISRPSKSSGDVSITPFFAYDTRAVKRGVREFSKKWGDRPLVDNWRMRAKIEASFASDTLQDAAKTKEAEISDQELDNILAEVPSNASEVTAANKLIEDALFELGKLFREKLENHSKSVANLETLLSRYPETQHKLEAYYYLYLGYTDLRNQSKAQEYYDKILREFPESLYARVLKNPNYFKETEDKERQLNAYYDDAYAAFSKGQYQTAYEKVTKSEGLFGTNNPFRARFALLSAMCMGNLQGKDAYINGLKEIIAKYPETPEQKRAREILRLLGDNSQTIGIDDGADNEVNKDLNASNFVFENDDQHYIIISLDEKDDLGKAKSQLGDYHRQYHNLDNYKISNIYLDDGKTKMPLLVIRKMKNKDDAMRYFDGVKNNSASFLSKEFNFQIYPISQNNYRKVLTQKSLNGYDSFFQQNYLN